MSWHFEFNASTRKDALRVWDLKIGAMAEYTRIEAEAEFGYMRACIERLIDLHSGFWRIKTYGHHTKDESNIDRPTRLHGIFFEVKREQLE